MIQLQFMQKDLVQDYFRSILTHVHFPCIIYSERFLIFDYLLIVSLLDQ